MFGCLFGHDWMGWSDPQPLPGVGVFQQRNCYRCNKMIVREVEGMFSMLVKGKEDVKGDARG